MREPSAAHEILQVLISRGVDRVFGIPGGTIAPLFDALLDFDIELVLCQQETMAVYAASAYAEATGKPGVVFVTSGPGLLNAVTGVAAAYHAEVPLILIGGEVAHRSLGRGALQDGGGSGLDMETIFGPFTKRTEAFFSTSRGPAMVDQALATALSVPMGPVFLRIPVDLVAGAHSGGQVVPSVPVPAPAPSLDACEQIALMLQSATKSVIFAGVGARRAGAAQALRRLAEASGCPVVTDVEAKSLFPESHPLSAGVYGVGGRGAAAALINGRTNLLLCFGARLDDTTTNNFSQAIASIETLVQIDHNPSRLGRAYRPQIAMHCDLVAAMDAITARLNPNRKPPAPWQSRVPPPPPTVVEPLGVAPHNPRAVVWALREVLGDDAVFSCDIGNHLLFAANELALDRPDSFYVSIGLGGMGSGIGYAIGLQMGLAGARQVVSVCGDGGMLMVGNEIATCAKYGVPVLFVVFNDGYLNMVQHGLERVMGRSIDCRTPAVDFCAYAESLGVESLRVNSLEDLRRISEWPRDAPLLVEVPIDPKFQASNPREDTINFNFPDEERVES